MYKYPKHIFLLLLVFLSLSASGKGRARSRTHSHSNIKTKDYKIGYSIGSSISNRGDITYNFTFIHDSTTHRFVKSYYNAQITVDNNSNLAYNFEYDIGGVKNENSYGLSVDYQPAAASYDEQIWYSFNSYVNLNESIFIYAGPSVEQYSKTFVADYGAGASIYLGPMRKINTRKTQSDFYFGYFAGLQTGLFNEDKSDNTTMPYVQISLNIIR